MTAPAALATRAIASGPIAGTLPDAPNAWAAQDTVYVVELVAYDLALPGTVTLRYATHAFATRPTDSPADTAIDGRVRDPGDLTRTLGDGGIPDARARVTFGAIVLENADGALDALGDYGLGGRAVTVRRGPRGGAYPYDFPVDYVAEVEAVTITRREVRLRLRDGRRALETPLLTTRFAGDNVPPDGLEGEAELEGAIKPRVYGQVRNVPLTCVNAQKLIYQVSDTECESVGTVYDAGVVLGRTKLGSEVEVTDLLGALVLAGVYVEEWGFYVAVSAGGFGGAGGTGRVITSSDLDSWTVEATNASGVRLWDVTWSPEAALAVAVGNDGTCYSSPDGATWTTQTIPASFDAEGVAYGQGLFVAVGNSADVYTSPDGATWTARALPSGAWLRSVTFADGLFVAVGASGKIFTSPDGITWTERTSPLTTNWRMVRYFEPRALWVVGGGASIVVSQDAVTWTERVVSGAGSNISDVCVTESLILAVETAVGGDPVISADGIAWNAVSITSSFTTWGAFPTADGNIVLFGEAGGGSYYILLEEYGTYTNATQLEDDSLAPSPGTAKVLYSSSGTYIRVGAQPFGQLTADVTQGATAADRSAAALIEQVLTDAGYTSSDWVAADFTALDTADNAVQGLYVTTATGAEVLDRLAGSVGAFWGFDARGRVRVRQFTAPTGTAALALTDDDLLEFDQLPFLQPSARTTLRYARNHTVQRDGLAGAVSAARRADLGREWREATSADAAVRTAHLLAEETTEETTFAAAADAAAEAARRQTLRGTLRRRYAATIARTEAAARLDLGDVVQVTSARFGLGGGALFRVTATETLRASGRLRLTLYR